MQELKSSVKMMTRPFINKDLPELERVHRSQYKRLQSKNLPRPKLDEFWLLGIQMRLQLERELEAEPNQGRLMLEAVLDKTEADCAA